MVLAFEGLQFRRFLAGVMEKRWRGHDVWTTKISSLISQQHAASSFPARTASTAPLSRKITTSELVSEQSVPSINHLPSIYSSVRSNDHA
jgi:hypothetical protein